MVFLQIIKSNHNYDTRNKGDYQLSMQRVNTIVNTGPKLWNELPKYVKSSKTLGLFKKNISLCFPFGQLINLIHLDLNRIVISVLCLYMMSHNIQHY